jgi:hypothetical protein
MGLTLEQLADVNYMEAYHDGRHSCREKYKKSNLLVIDPRQDLEKITEDPCVNCELHCSDLKKGCLSICEKKRKQMDALEIKQHFSQLPKNEGIVWHDIVTEGLPPEFQPKYCKDEHTESVFVLVWDTFYGPSIDRLWDGVWVSDRKRMEGNIIEPAVCHEIVAWAYIPIPESVDPNLFKKVDKDGNIYY